MKIVFLVLSLFICSCTSSKSSLKNVEADYLESARINYEAGLKAIDNKEYENAIGYFQFIRSKYPITKYAALSSLKIADARYKMEKWLDAASAYNEFKSLYPLHEQTPHASFMAAQSYFKSLPNDYFFLPHSSTKDQSITNLALEHYDAFISEYPAHENLQEALEKRAILYERLALSYANTADYYESRKKYLASFNRHVMIINKYPNTKNYELSLFKAGQIAFLHLKDNKSALDYLVKYISLELANKQTEKAKQYLKEILTDNNDAAQP